MATSGSTDFSVSAEDIIKASLQTLRVLKKDVPFLPRHTVDVAKLHLNLILKEWTNYGLNLWTIEKGTVYLTEHKYIYKLGDFRSDSYLDSDLWKHVYNFASVNVGSSILDVPINYASWPWGDPATATSMKVSLMTDSDFPRESTVTAYSDNTTFTRLTLGTDLDSYCADNSGYTGILKQRVNENVIRIEPESVQLIYNNASRTKSKLEVVARTDFDNLSDDYSPGIVNQVYFRRQKEGAELFVNPVPNSDAAYYSIELSYMRPIEDIDDRADDLEVPVHYARAIKDQLTAELAGLYEIPLDERGFLYQLAEKSKSLALSDDKEQVPTFFDYTGERS